MAVHFDVPKLLGKDTKWRIETDGSEAALKKFLEKDSEVAVLWEPDVSRALLKKGTVKLLGTEDTDKLIVDILIVNRKYSQQEPDAVATLLKQYYHTLKFYRDNPQSLVDDAAKETNLDKSLVSTMLNGVSWATLSDNSMSWYGLSALGSTSTEGLVDAIESTINILIDHGDYSQSPLPDSDPYRIINSQFVSDLFSANVSNTQFGKTKNREISGGAEMSLEKDFEKLSDSQWQALREIGTLKIRPIVFQSGVDELGVDSKKELDKAIENLKHYPNFRIVIKGHTGVRGDKAANQKLSQGRSETVARYFNVTYGIDLDRMRPIGMGSSQPLSRKAGESNRTYNYRLPRVELFLVTEDL
jgi:outer membrane protein OmpA-like peptidoglycan-associated protein